MKKLNEFLNCQYNTLIKDIKIDSREVEEGDLFVAVSGFNVDHSEYIDDAIEKGAAAIVTNKDIEKEVPVVKVDDVNKMLDEICSRFYDYDYLQKLIGVTGTDGKTTTATMIFNILKDKHKIAYMGTNGIEYDGVNIKTENTTPTTEKLYKYLSNLEKNDCESVVMEVSSEALLHKRVDKFKFKYAIYTNITEDHLNIHHTIENYINSKFILADLVREDGAVIINIDDINCKKLLNRNKKIYTYGIDSKSDFRIENIVESSKTLEFDIAYKKSIFHIKSSFIGKYNAYNLTASFIVCYLEGIKEDEIVKKIENMSAIPGRGEVLDFSQNYKLILDYAHTENGIKTIVDSVKDKYSKIILLTGAAGGREKSKRSKIGKYILENTDLVIFTMDDPRFESVDEIIDQMIGEETSDNYVRINDRKDAIYYALKTATEGDIVLILGKGRDNYMAIEDKRVPYSDYDVIESYFNKN